MYSAGGEGRSAGERFVDAAEEHDVIDQSLISPLFFLLQLKDSLIHKYNVSLTVTG